MLRIDQAHADGRTNAIEGRPLLTRRAPSLIVDRAALLVFSVFSVLLVLLVLLLTPFPSAVLIPIQYLRPGWSIKHRPTLESLEHGHYRVKFAPKKKTEEMIVRVWYRRFGHSTRLWRPTPVEGPPAQRPSTATTTATKPRSRSKYGQWYSEMLPPMIPIALLAATVYGVRETGGTRVACACGPLDDMILTDILAFLRYHIQCLPPCQL